MLKSKGNHAGYSSKCTTAKGQNNPVCLLQKRHGPPKPTSLYNHPSKPTLPSGSGLHRETGKCDQLTEIEKHVYYQGIDFGQKSALYNIPAQRNRKM